MKERLRPNPNPIVLGTTEIVIGRKTHFEILLANAAGRILNESDRLEGLDALETWKVDGDKIFFYSPFTKGVLVCEVNSDKKSTVFSKSGEKFEELTVSLVGSHADRWFSDLFNHPELVAVAKTAPNPK